MFLLRVELVLIQSACPKSGELFRLWNVYVESVLFLWEFEALQCHRLWVITGGCYPKLACYMEAVSQAGRLAGCMVGDSDALHYQV